jgi:hypothetical protein
MGTFNGARDGVHDRSPVDGIATRHAAARRVLKTWAVRGTLERRLAAFTPGALVALHDAVFAMRDAPAPLTSNRRLARLLAALSYRHVVVLRASLPAPTGAAAAAVIDTLQLRLALAAILVYEDATVSPERLRTWVDARVPPPPDERIAQLSYRAEARSR